MDRRGVEPFVQWAVTESAVERDPGARPLEQEDLDRGRRDMNVVAVHGPDEWTPVRRDEIGRDVVDELCVGPALCE